MHVMSELTRLRDEAERLLTVYRMYKDSEDPTLRRRAHVEVDRFLMEHRETALICIEQVLSDEFNRLAEKDKPVKIPWYKRKFKRGGVVTDERSITRDA